MMGHHGIARRRLVALAGGSSLLALTLVAAPASAQDTSAPEAQTSTTSPTSTSPDTTRAPLAQTSASDASAQEATGDDIVVTGIRASLAKAQDIKRNSDTVVDAITAEDIGALPDRSVNEALQRVPGVAITRYASAEDSQHFSVEGSGVTVRGLNYVKGEFNGRDTFSTNGGREISFNDVAPELVGSIEVFKNLSADRIEGGISGTISINTRKPFDSKDRLIYLSGEINYGDLAERSAPSFTGLFSQQWTLGGGERIGLLVSGTYSRLYSKVDSAFVASPFERFTGTRTFNAGTPFQSTVTDTFNCGGPTSCYAPTGGGVRTQDFDRRRYGIAAAAQFATADDSVIATAQFLRTSGKNSWTEHTIEPNVYYADVNATFPAPGTSYTYNEDGVFVSGQINRPGGLHEGNLGPGNYGPLNNFQEGGIFTTLSNRGFITDYTTDDYALNFKVSPSDRLTITLDGQYINTRAKETDVIVDGATFSNIAIDTSGKIPDVTFSHNFVPDYGRAPSAQEYFANPNSVYFRDAFTDLDDNEGEEWAGRIDMDYDLSDTGFLRKVHVGGRYSDRDQKVRNNNYNNWGAPSETWTGPNGAQTFATIPQSRYELFQYDNFFRGAAAMPPGANYLIGNIAEDYAATQQLLREITARAVGNYVPLEDRTCGIVDGFFCPNEVFVNSERTLAGYLRVDFGADLGGDSKFDGNIGVRFVNTLDRALGSLTFPQRSQIYDDTKEDGFTFQSVAEFCALPRDPGTQQPAICGVSAAEQGQIIAFSNGAAPAVVARNNFNNWLPSLNLRYQLNNDVQFRFAASRAISRPNFGNLRSFVGIGSVATQAGGLAFQAGSQNPYLRPVEATQFDLTGEWYFSRVGSLTGALFYKKLSNFIDTNGQRTQSFTNNGITRDVTINGPVNLDGSADIKGFEVSYQQTYDFLPGVLSGLGMQATYTYIDAGNIPSNTPANGPGDGARPPGEVTDLYALLPLPQLSTHNVNVSGFYDKDGFYARVAYSWRSRYLLSTRDCCFPFLPVFSEATGQLDGSLFYTVNNRFKFGLQVSNILNEVTQTSFALFADGDRIVRSKRGAFITDRRFGLSVRLTL